MPGKYQRSAFDFEQGCRILFYPTMKFRLTRHLSEQWHKLLRLEGSPRAVALGVAIGVFFGFMPLFGFKTLLAVAVTWMLRGNVLAGVIGVTLHDVLLPLMPVLLIWEYDLGYWLLSHPHLWPPKMHLPHHHDPGIWLHWSTFLTVGRPLLVGSIVVSTPPAIAAYFVMHGIMSRARKRELRIHPERPHDDPTNGID
jgi:hypothetical protein